VSGHRWRADRKSLPSAGSRLLSDRRKRIDREVELAGLETGDLLSAIGQAPLLWAPFLQLRLS